LQDEAEEAAMANVNPIPEGYPRVIPYLSIDGAAEAIKFYANVFGATERVRMDAPDGKVGHAELEIGDGLVMLADTFPDMGARSPKDVGGTPVTVMVYVTDVDDCFKRALDNGATAIGEGVQDQFYGDRAGSFEDPFGHHWHVATHIEDVSPEEMGKRAAEAMGG
jgi:PhnB protein